MLELSSKRKPQAKEKNGYNVHMDKIADIDEKLEQRMKDKTLHTIAESATSRFLMDHDDYKRYEQQNEVIDKTKK